MKDLYRIVPYNYETEDEPVFVGRRQMLVKVEPDYEAAGQAIWNSIQGDGSVTWQREDQTIKKQYVQWGYLAVDAALGGTDDE